MSFKAGLLASVAIHASVIGSVAALKIFGEEPPSAEEGTVEIYFELVEERRVEEAAPSQEEPPRDEEATRDEEPPPVEAPRDEEPRVEEEPPPSQEPPCVEEPRVEKPPVSRAEETAPGESPDESAKVVAEPFALGRITPKYPRSARRKGHEGRVTVEAFVEEDGAVFGAQVVSSSTFAELDEAAVAAVVSAKFAPAREDGACVRGKVRLTFDFKLE